MDWQGLIDAIHAHGAQVSRCWHPAPRGELTAARNGSMIAVHVGQPAYQLTTGAIITL